MGKLSELLSGFQASNPVAVFDKSGQSGAARYKYASYNAIIEHLKPLAANGLYWTHEVGGQVSQADTYSLIVSTTIGAGDETRTATITLPMPPNIQTMGSHITYAKRYQLVALCGMAADEDDDGAVAQAEQTSKPAARAPSRPAASAAKPAAEAPAPADSSTKDTLAKAIAEIKKSTTARSRQELLALVGTRVKQGKLTQQDYHEFGRTMLTFVTDPDEATTNIQALFEVAKEEKVIDDKIASQLESLVNQRVHQLANMAKIGGTMKAGS